MRLKTVLVTGSTGQLGQSLEKLSLTEPNFDFTFVGRQSLDLASPESIAEFFQKQRFDYIINCAAYTAVDKAESDTELADQINHLAVKQLAEVAKQQDSMLIHISTDYVYDGQNYRPYREEDSVAPQGVYGLTKLKGEQAMQSVHPKGCIIRTSWVYSEFGNNFVKTMLRLGTERDQLNVIFDQVGSPTYAGDLAQAILTVIASEAKQSPEIATASGLAMTQSKPDIESDSLVIASVAKQSALLMQDKDQQIADDHHSASKVEIYHYSNEGVCSWYDFAHTIFELSAVKCNVNPIETKDYPTPAKRPYYSLMNKIKIKQAFNLQIPYWKDSLNHCLQILEK